MLHLIHLFTYVDWTGSTWPDMLPVGALPPLPLWPLPAESTYINSANPAVIHGKIIQAAP